MVKGKILIVDNSESTRIFMRYVLVNAGFLVSAVKSAAEALEQANDLPFDAVVTDLLSPELDGLKLIKELRTHRWYEHKPMLVVSILKAPAMIQQGMDAGATEWLIKPISPNKFVALLKTLCPDKNDDDIRLDYDDEDDDEDDNDKD